MRVNKEKTTEWTFENSYTNVFRKGGLGGCCCCGGGSPASSVRGVEFRQQDDGRRLQAGVH